MILVKTLGILSGVEQAESSVGEKKIGEIEANDSLRWQKARGDPSTISPARLTWCFLSPAAPGAHA